MTRQIQITSVVQIQEENVKNWIKEKGKDPEKISDWYWKEYVRCRHSNSYGVVTDIKIVD